MTRPCSYAILQRDVDTYRQLYNAVLKRMKDMGVEAEAQTSNVSIVDKATAPRIACLSQEDARPDGERRSWVCSARSGSPSCSTTSTTR